MIELAASVPTSPKITAVTPVSLPGTVDFTATLTGLLGGGAETPLLPGVADKRQAVAGDGKTLPEVATDDDLSKDLIWLPAALMAPVPLPATVKLAMPVGAAVTPTAATVTALPTLLPGAAVPSPASPSLEIEAAPFTLPSTPAEAGAQLGEAGDPSLSSPDWTPAFAGEQKAPAKDGIVLPRGMDVAKADAPVRGVPAPQPAQPQQPLLQPAGQVFASAIAVAVQAQSHRERETEARSPLTIATAALDAVAAPAIAATPDAQQAALDLRQDSGLQGMIDHIEVLRDGADANDTRIRLIPDALGAVDVSVRKDGERVHVHFNAESQTSARLIAEAQPRLAELAEARGVRLGDTSVDSNGGGDTRQPPPATPFLAATPASVSEPADPLTDIRIA